jgi:hypothetical protein
MRESVRSADELLPPVLVIALLSRSETPAGMSVSELRLDAAVESAVMPVSKSRTGISLVDSAIAFPFGSTLVLRAVLRPIQSQTRTRRIPQIA